MIIKFCRVGKSWGHEDRARKTMINHSLSLCPMYLTYKDHKGWKGDDNSPPPTRPIAGGNTGMNLHLSEALSEMIEPLADIYEGANEIISTEELKAKIEALNLKNEGWTKWRWWDGITTKNGRFLCCSKCVPEQVPPALDSEDASSPVRLPDELTGTPAEERMSDEDRNNLCKCEDERATKSVENWEHFWETEEGQDTRFWTLTKEKWEKEKSKNKILKTNPKLMRKLRKLEWEADKRREDLEDLDRVWGGPEVLEEDLQDVEAPFVLIGCDVEALYPSLDVGRCAKEVEEEVMRSSLRWEELDYLEGARLIALNRSAEYYRSHTLQRVLPVRRGRTGSRPGVTGKGPMGPERGDQEQWRFPDIILAEEEKKPIVAEVIKIMIEILFKNHLYTFGGKRYRQKKGGPIGLRATCAIARLVICAWDRKWKELITKNNITLEEDIRYMDDGRIILLPFRPGWRWSEGGVKFTKRWAMEDKDRTGLEITKDILDESMQEVFPYLNFTTEVGEGEEEWLPTVDIMMRIEPNNILSYKYFEKTTTTNAMIQKRSALDENSKIQMLSNELMRRLANTDSRQKRRVVAEI